MEASTKKRKIASSKNNRLLFANKALIEVEFFLSAGFFCASSVKRFDRVSTVNTRRAKAVSVLHI